MAGAGYKLFNTGDVLTAAQVNTYLMEQTVMVFADAAARTTALSGVVSEGMISYLKDTNAVEVYNGSAWVASDDPNAIQNTIVDAKGDLITATAADTPARIAVGNPGETLVADSSATTGLRWQGNFSAGKNVIINGDFKINQRAFTSNTSSGSFNYDRFWQSNSGGTVTTTPNVFTPGSAPVAGYEATNYPQVAVTGQSAASHYAHYSQSIEDVRTLAGQTITISFWAKASSGTPKIGVEWQQFFGSGGSSAVSTPAGAVTISTSWTRYSITISSPSLSGKTIGTSSGVNLNLWLSAGSDSATRASSIGIQTATFQIWGVQVEAGNTATAFQTATGTLAGELAACQRYYYRKNASSSGPYAVFAFGSGTESSIAAVGYIQTPVPLRTYPSSVEYGGTIRIIPFAGAESNISAIALQDRTSTETISITFTGSGMTGGNYCYIRANNSSTAYIGVSAEL